MPMTPTTNLALIKSVGTDNARDYIINDLGDNLDKLDIHTHALIGRIKTGLHADRPTVDTNGDIYFETDTKFLFMYCTSAWVCVTLPIGSIIMWSGSYATLPVGWSLCDGAGGRPDLQSTFIVGAGSTYAVGASGGALTKAITHSHIADSVATSTDAHTHTTTGAASVSTDTSPADHSVTGLVTGSVAGHSHTVANGTDFYASEIGYGGLMGDRRSVSVTTSVSHTHTTSFTGGGVYSHTHTAPTATSGSSSHSHTLTGTSANNTDSVANVPPYYLLAYIQKVL